MGATKSHSWPEYEEAEESTDTNWHASSEPSQQMSGNGTTAAQPRPAGAVPAGAGGAFVSPTRGRETYPAHHCRVPVGACQTAPVPMMYAAASQVHLGLEQQGQFQQQQQQQQKLTQGGQAACGQPQETIIIFDWDDTLMCSSAINANQLFPHQAAQLEAVLEQVLSGSMRLGETCIVTNADELWVLESTRRYCPRVLPLLSQISVVSARRKYEHSYPGDVFAWKRETFREVLAKRKGAAQVGGSAGSSLNLVVLGDSPAEMEAAQTSTYGATYPLTIKQVKFKEIPTVDELVDQLHITLQELSSIVTDDRSSYRSLSARLWPQQAVAQFQTQPASYALAPALSPTLGYTPPLATAVAAYPAQTSTYYGGAHMTYVVGH